MPYRVIRENGQYVFQILAPCVSREDLTVNIDKDQIEVKRAEREENRTIEYASCGFEFESDATRTIAIKEYNLNWRKAESVYANGILTITIPRLNPAIALFIR